MPLPTIYRASDLQMQWSHLAALGLTDKWRAHCNEVVGVCAKCNESCFKCSITNAVDHLHRVFAYSLLRLFTGWSQIMLDVHLTSTEMNVVEGLLTGQHWYAMHPTCIAHNIPSFVFNRCVPDSNLCHNPFLMCTLALLYSFPWQIQLQGWEFLTVIWKGVVEGDKAQKSFRSLKPVDPLPEWRIIKNCLIVAQRMVEYLLLVISCLRWAISERRGVSGSGYNWVCSILTWTFRFADVELMVARRESHFCVK